MRYRASIDQLARARRVTPNGTQTRSKSVTMGVEGAMPAFVRRAKGARFWDVDGHEYVDFSMALACVGLGYAYDAVDEAVIRQVRDGASYSLAHPLETDVAERLCEIIPCAESVRFVKSGSEATEAAMRIARVVTGNDIIVSIGYHGWHSVHDAAKKDHPDVPHDLSRVIQEHPYNDPVIAEDFIHEYYGGIAAVLLEPTLHDPPAPGFLQALRDWCTSRGALLIFDEVVTGFRWALGGAQEYFGVTPDLACFGKAMANGMPLACVVGKRDYMEQGAPYVSSSFGGEAVSLAAAKATIDVYRTEPVIARLWEIGAKFQNEFNRQAWLTRAVPLSCDGYPVKPVIRVTGDRTPEAARVLLSIFMQEAAAAGAFFHPTSNNVSYSHTDADLTDALRACRAGFMAVADALASPHPETFLKGPAYRPSFVRA